MKHRSAILKSGLRGQHLLRFWGGLGVALLSTLAIVGLASLPPFIGEAARFAVMEAFSLVCHQMPARSPHVDGVALAVCHRCYGIYAGLAAGTLLVPLLPRWEDRLRRQAGPMLLLALLPVALDWSGDVAGLWSNTPLSRLLTGGFFGVAAGFYFGRALARFAAPAAGPSAPSTFHTQGHPSALPPAA